MSEQELDTELIECEICKKVLNGKSLWVVSDFNDEPMTICEECQQLRRVKNEKPN
jgi:predicted nucleic acid-binding Zn ribbon protein